MHRLQVGPQICHPVGDLAADPARGEAQVHIAMLPKRVEVAVPLATDVTPVVSWKQVGLSVTIDIPDSQRPYGGGPQHWTYHGFGTTYVNNTSVESVVTGD